MTRFFGFGIAVQASSVFTLFLRRSKIGPLCSDGHGFAWRCANESIICFRLTQLFAGRPLLYSNRQQANQNDVDISQFRVIEPHACVAKWCSLRGSDKMIKLIKVDIGFRMYWTFFLKRTRDIQLNRTQFHHSTYIEAVECVFNTKKHMIRWMRSSVCHVLNIESDNTATNYENRQDTRHMWSYGLCLCYILNVRFEKRCNRGWVHSVHCPQTNLYYIPPTRS